MEIEYLIDTFCENGHDRLILQKIINNFEKKIPSTNSNNNNNNNTNTTTNNNNNNTEKSKQLPFLEYQKLEQNQTRNTKVWI